MIKANVKTDNNSIDFTPPKLLIRHNNIIMVLSEEQDTFKGIILCDVSDSKPRTEIKTYSKKDDLFFDFHGILTLSNY